ncbi:MULTISPECIES: pyocin knob domain-containing protein [unclassified Clostridium]|uniref:pyocin knob domain-containing protein n=1 Tax=unclassified Clostridium TaxID=2614128 RepID=UPI00207952FD|nr:MULTISPECIES: pyocin knob domain-containing protein [unclassified Clostridium]
MATFNYVDENGEVQEFDVNANDIQALDVEGYYDNKNLEDILETLGEANRLYLVENEEQIKKGKAGIYFCDDILDNREDNNVVKRIKDYLNLIAGDLNNLKTNDKTNLVNAINENTSYLKDITNNINEVNGTNTAIDLNLIMKTGVSYSQNTDINTLNTPYKQGLTSANRAIVNSFFSSTQHGIQISYNAGGFIFMRKLSSGIWSEWEQLATTEKFELSTQNQWYIAWSTDSNNSISCEKNGLTTHVYAILVAGISTESTIIAQFPNVGKAKWIFAFCEDSTMAKFYLGWDGNLIVKAGVQQGKLYIFDFSYRNN